jgi:hypothetical protein
MRTLDMRCCLHMDALQLLLSRGEEEMGSRPSQCSNFRFAPQIDGNKRKEASSHDFMHKSSIQSYYIVVLLARSSTFLYNLTSTNTPPSSILIYPDALILYPWICSFEPKPTTTLLPIIGIPA